jgi:multicomponent Na+:H+ antiporter subunit B
VGVLGLILAALTATAPMLFGESFFTHHMTHFNVPLLGEVEVGTTLLFDLGVYFVVVGVSVKIILVLSWSTNGYPTFVAEEEKRYASVLERPIEEMPDQEPFEDSEEEPHAD